MPDTGTNQPATGGTTPMTVGGVSAMNPAMGGMPMANPMAPIGGVMGLAGNEMNEPGMSSAASVMNDTSGVSSATSSVNDMSGVGASVSNVASEIPTGEGATREIPGGEKAAEQNQEMPNNGVAMKSATQAADLEIRDKEKQNLTEVQKAVIKQVEELHNVLVALSSNPSVDELAAAIGLTIYLDKIGKRATAIYSGETPNALEFLKPEETFDRSADVLQDFVIALNKDKADHLRYKLDGDFVRIYITPYRAKITADDLEYSYGDYNVDLVLALDVANGVDLDEALREHGRIMHDAVVVDVTTGNPGKLGEIQWTDKNASSVSEMLAGMIYNMGGEPIGEDEATAFLTGIVAATNRFSSAGTTPITMEIASRLMEAGAKHQLISKNITAEMNNELFQTGQKKENGVARKKEMEISDDSAIDIDRGDNKTDVKTQSKEAEKVDESKDEKKDEETEQSVNEGKEEQADESEKRETNVGPIGMEETVGPIDAAGPIGAEDTVGPVDTAGSTETVEPMNTTDSTETVGPMDASESIGAAESVNSTEPATETTDSMETVGPVNEAESVVAEAVNTVGETNEQSGATTLEEEPEEDMSLLNDIKAAEESLKGAGAETVVEKTKPMMIEGGEMVQEPMHESVQGAMQADSMQEPIQSVATEKQEKVLEPSAELKEESAGGVNKYGQMLQDALNGVTSGNMPETYAAGVPNAPMMSDSETEMLGAVPTMGENMPEMSGAPMNEMLVANGNVAETYAPAVPSAPEINGVPEMNYMPMPGDQVLPPPPTPPIDMDAPVDANGMIMPDASQMPGEAPMDTQMTGGMPMGAVAPMDNQVNMGVPMETQTSMGVPIDTQTTMPENYGASQSANGVAPMATELPNVVMDGAEAGPAPVPAMEPVPNPMMGTTAQPAVETAPVVDSVPAAEPVQDAMASEPYDPSAFRIPGIK